MHKITLIPSCWSLITTVLLFGVFGFGFMACTQTSSQTPSHQGILHVTVVSGPTCPGPGAAPDMPTPPACADQPVQHHQIEIKTADDQVTATVTTDQHGQFTVALPAGFYLMTTSFGLLVQQSKPVIVVAGRTTTVQMTLDTGIGPEKWTLETWRSAPFRLMCLLENKWTDILECRVQTDGIVEALYVLKDG